LPCSRTLGRRSPKATRTRRYLTWSSMATVAFTAIAYPDVGTGIAYPEPAITARIALLSRRVTHRAIRTYGRGRNGCRAVDAVRSEPSAGSRPVFRCVMPRRPPFLETPRGKLAARTFHLVFSGIGRVYLGEPVTPPRYPVWWANPPWRYDRLTPGASMG